MSTQRDLEIRRQAWLAFASAALSGYTPMQETYPDADDLIEETTENSAAIADAMLAEYLEREDKEFNVHEETEEEQDPDEEEEEDEEEEDEEEEEESRRPVKRRAASKRPRRG